jgi:hypothetical protein
MGLVGGERGEYGGGGGGGMSMEQAGIFSSDTGQNPVFYGFDESIQPLAANLLGNSLMPGGSDSNLFGSGVFKVPGFGKIEDDNNLGSSFPPDLEQLPSPISNNFNSPYGPPGLLATGQRGNFTNQTQPIMGSQGNFNLRVPGGPQAGHPGMQTQESQLPNQPPQMPKKKRAQEIENPIDRKLRYWEENTVDASQVMGDTLLTVSSDMT